MSTVTTWNLLKETFTAWNDDRAPRLAAALAYYTIFALAPLLILAVAIAGFFFNEDQVRQNVLNEIGTLVGANGRQAVEAMIDGVRQPGSGLIATVVGAVTLLVATGLFFGQLQDALNTIWGVRTKSGRGLKGLIKDRLLSFSMVLGIGFLLLISLLISAALSAASRFLDYGIAQEAWLWQTINLTVSFGVTVVLFAMIFKILPDAKVRWRDVWIGAVATAVLFSLGRFLIGFYLGQTATASAYGAAGSLVALLVWVYYSTQILFLGAKFTQVYARHYGAQIEPAANAVRVTLQERTEEGQADALPKTTKATAPQLHIPAPSQPLKPTPVGQVILAFVFGAVVAWQRKPPHA